MLNQDKKIVRIISQILRIGVAFAIVTIFFGGILFFFQDGSLPAAFERFKGEPNYLSSIPAMIEAVVKWNSLAIIQLGIFFLILTPIVRVATCIALFAHEKDSLYIVLSSLVFLILLYSLFGL